MNTETSLGHRAKAHWQFDESVARVFDDMLERSIPEYAAMRDLVFSLGSHFVKPNTAIVDLGAARGGSIAALLNRHGAANRYIAVEIAEPMLGALRERFRGYIDAKILAVLPLDLRLAYPGNPASLTLAILTLQFVPIEYRQNVLDHAFSATRDGGAMIVVEKILGADGGFQDLFVTRYWQMKSENGYTQDEIDRKRLALEGVLVPVTAAMNESMLRAAGFKRVECFWRWCNFAGWIAVKE
jgi:tRNA (cmo5U34)-methyltransferase